MGGVATGPGDRAWRGRGAGPGAAAAVMKFGGAELSEGQGSQLSPVLSRNKGS